MWGKGLNNGVPVLAMIMINRLKSVNDAPDKSAVGVFNWCDAGVELKLPYMLTCALPAFGFSEYLLVSQAKKLCCMSKKGSAFVGVASSVFFSFL